MSNFIPRLNPPSTNDNRWIQINSGGYNQCIYGSDGSPSVLPNCTGYVHGRWMEIAHINSDTLGLSFGDAKAYFNGSDASLVRLAEPEVGAVLCFGQTASMPSGHVCIVEEIIDADTIVCSESDWGWQRFSVRTRRRSWGWDWIANGDSLFQGFLRHPDIQPTPTGHFKWWMARKLLVRRRNGL